MVADGGRGTGEMEVLIQGQSRAAGDDDAGSAYGPRGASLGVKL